MTTTPHDATGYTNPAQQSPAGTAVNNAVEVGLSADSYHRSFESTVSQYEALTGTGPVPPEPEGGQALPDIPWESSWTVAEVKEWVAGTPDFDTWHHGVSVDGEPVGAGQLERALEAYSQELANANRVTLLGWLENIPGVFE